MSKESLKTLRIIIPGLIILIFGIPLFQSNLDLANIFKTLSLLEGVVYLVVVGTLGALYYITNIRGRFLRSSLESIHNNIKAKLLEPFANDKSIFPSEKKLREGRNLIQVFYQLIDNHETLKEKAKNVHLNGLIWSTMADLRALSLIFFLTYFFYGLAVNKQVYIFIAIALLLLYLLVTYVFAPRVTKMHIGFSNEQLEFIQVHLKKELHDLLIQIIKSWK